MKLLGEFIYFALAAGIGVLFLITLFVEMVSWYKADESALFPMQVPDFKQEDV